jgi:hypothetical protein
LWCIPYGRLLLAKIAACEKPCKKFFDWIVRWRGAATEVSCVLFKLENLRGYPSEGYTDVYRTAASVFPFVLLWDIRDSIFEDLERIVSSRSDGSLVAESMAPRKRVKIEGSASGIGMDVPWSSWE